MWSLTDPLHSCEGPPLFQQELLEPQANSLEFLGPILARRRNFYKGICATWMWEIKYFDFDWMHSCSVGPLCSSMQGCCTQILQYGYTHFLHSIIKLSSKFCLILQRARRGIACNTCFLTLMDLGYSSIKVILFYQSQPRESNFWFFYHTNLDIIYKVL